MDSNFNTGDFLKLSDVIKEKENLSIENSPVIYYFVKKMIYLYEKKKKKKMKKENDPEKLVVNCQYLVIRNWGDFVITIKKGKGEYPFDSIKDELKDLNKFEIKQTRLDIDTSSQVKVHNSTEDVLLAEEAVKRFNRSIIRK